MPVILSISVLIVLLDQTTKFLAVEFLRPLEQVTILPNIFHLSYVQNTGIAFGLFQNYPAAWSLIITVSVLFLFIGIRFLMNQPLSHKVAYGFVLGGAVGNWIDRVRLHYVIDFLDFRIWPVFNVADSFITVGVIMFIWFALKGR